MNSLPTLKPSSAHGETHAGVTYHLDGDLVPVLTVDVSRRPVFFEHHILLWKHREVTLGLHSMRRAFKRMLAGLPVLLAEAQGGGMIAFSRDGVGQIIPIHMEPGREILVREHQFLAATANVDYSCERVRGIANLLYGHSGFFIDRFRSDDEGILWLHGYGNVFEKLLAPGEVIDIEPSGWLYRDPTVSMETTVASLSVGLFGNASMTLNRFTGPGRIGIQSMYVHLPTAE